MYGSKQSQKTIILLIFIHFLSCSSNQEQEAIVCDSEHCEASGCQELYLHLIDQNNDCVRPSSYCTSEGLFYLDEGLERTTRMIFKDEYDQCWETLSTSAPAELTRVTADDKICGKYTAQASEYIHLRYCPDVDIDYDKYNDPASFE